MNARTLPTTRNARSNERCRNCGHPLCRGRRSQPAPRGERRHQGRGLCEPCYTAAWRAGTLADAQRATRTHDEVLDALARLRTEGVTRRRDVATRIGCTVKALERHITRARRAGDPRAA